MALQPICVLTPRESPADPISRSPYNTGIGEEGAGARAVEAFELMQVLEDGPELHPVAGHEAIGAHDRFERAERGELIEQEQDGGGRLDG
jgi:hypothetical protein